MFIHSKTVSPTMCMTFFEVLVVLESKNPPRLLPRGCKSPPAGPQPNVESNQKSRIFTKILGKYSFTLGPAGSESTPGVFHRLKYV